MILAPSADVGTEPGMVPLLGLLRRCCPELFRKFALAVFDEGRKFHCSIIRNFDAWRGASNAHRCDGSIDLHIARLRDIAGNKSERSPGQLNMVELDFPFGSYTNSFNAMRALLDRLNELPS